MANKVFLNKKGVIEQIYEGRQTFQSVMRAAARVMFLGDDLHKNKKKIRILVNVGGITTVSADALLAAADSLNTILKSKIAVYGGSKLINKLGNLVIMATGRAKTVKIFKSLKLAEKWLM
jgi:hypothetical protein